MNLKFGAPEYFGFFCGTTNMHKINCYKKINIGTYYILFEWIKKIGSMYKHIIMDLKTISLVSLILYFVKA